MIREKTSKNRSVIRFVMSRISKWQILGDFFVVTINGNRNALNAAPPFTDCVGRIVNDIRVSDTEGRKMLPNEHSKQLLTSNWSRHHETHRIIKALLKLLYSLIRLFRSSTMMPFIWLFYASITFLHAIQVLFLVAVAAIIDFRPMNWIVIPWSRPGAKKYRTSNQYS